MLELLQILYDKGGKRMLRKYTKLEKKLAKDFLEFAKCKHFCNVPRTMSGPCTCGCAQLYEKAQKIAGV